MFGIDIAIPELPSTLHATSFSMTTEFDTYRKTMQQIADKNKSVHRSLLNNLSLKVTANQATLTAHYHHSSHSNEGRVYSPLNTLDR